MRVSKVLKEEGNVVAERENALSINMQPESQPLILSFHCLIYENPKNPKMPKLDKRLGEREGTKERKGRVVLDA